MPGPSPAGRRRGFTLVEALVVLFVLGLLIALILPAVLAAREAARRATCQNNLRQHGIALASHHAAHSQYPAVLPFIHKTRRGGKYALNSDYPACYYLLPYLEQLPLFNSINFGPDAEVGQGRSAADPANMTVNATAIAVFLCPSDSLADPSAGPNSYRFNVGSALVNVVHGGSKPVTGLTATTDYLFQAPAFPIAGPVDASQFADGLSQTVGMAERSFGSQGKVFRPDRDLWFAGSLQVAIPTSADAVAALCEAGDANVPDFDTRLGRSWAGNLFENSWYNHFMTPNARASDCTAESFLPSPATTLMNFVAITARSRHVDSATVLFMDGSVRPIGATIDRPVWRALGTRAGGEPLPTTY